MESMENHNFENWKHLDNKENIENIHKPGDGAPNVTYTMVWACMDHKTLHTHWFGHT